MVIFKNFFEKLFNTCQIPDAYKTQTVIPIYKKRDKTNPENFRPVVITPHPIKILERILRREISDYLEKNNLLNENQHGFRRHRSCSTQLISHTHNVFKNLIDGNEVDFIYLDYSKAFDKVDHNVLLKKLTLLSISENYIKWLECFLKGRIQFVVVGNQLSFPTIVQSGVPQGSVLAPVLYTTYINDLTNEIKSCEVLTFADDTKLISKINSVKDTISLQKSLSTAFSWSKENNMLLNDSKFDMMSFKPTQNNKSQNIFKSLPFSEQFFQYKLSNDNILEPSFCVKDLGIFIDSDLSWNTHIFKICKKSRQISGWILNTFDTRESLPMITLFNTMVRPILEYCCELWCPHKTKDIVEIEKLQRSFTYKILGMKQYNYWERLEKLKLMSLQRRREKLTIIYIWKIKNKIFPNSIDLQFRYHARFQSYLAILPPLPRTNKSLQTKYEESFVVRGAKLWNSLPPKLTHIEVLRQFKTLLNKYIEGLPDQPPLPGYSCANSNSLIDI